MAIRISGLNSGLDTDAIVQELVSAYGKKKENYVKKQTKLDWKMDAWKDLNKKVNSLYKKLGNLKLSSAYVKKTTTCSDPTKALVSASGSAINGNQTLKILQTAKAGYITGEKLADSVTGSTKLSELGLDGDAAVSATVKGQTKNIALTKDMTVREAAAKLQEAGISVSYDEVNKRMFVSAKESGVANDFALTATDANGVKALQGLGIYVDKDSNKEAYRAWDSYAVKNPDGSVNVAETEARLKEYLDNIAKNEAEIADLKSDTAARKTDNTNLLSKINYANSYQSLREALKAGDVQTDANGDTVLDGERNPVMTERLTAAEQEELADLLTKQEELSEDDKTRMNELKEKLAVEDKDWKKLEASADKVKKFEAEDDNAADVTAVREAYAANGVDGIQSLVGEVTTNPDGSESYSGWTGDIGQNNTAINNNTEAITEKTEYNKSHVLLTNAAPVDPDANGSDITSRVQTLLDKVQFANEQLTNGPAGGYSAAQQVKAEDAVIELNGVQYTSSSNNVTVNGLTITALQQTALGEEITISTSANAQGVYDTIKDFLKQYNELIKEMDKLYNAPSSKGYEPLTDDEKEEMSDKEIEKWEQKIKDSILRRDDTLSSVMNTMTMAMSKGFTLSDGKTYSLSSFGIKTQGYLAAAENEGYMYHIDGDAEDEITSGNMDRLMSAIQENPERVQEFFQKLTGDFYEQLDNRMRSSTTTHSTFTIYNDKTMQKEYDDYTKTIKKWEDKVSYMEEYYYQKFSAMETALAKLQNSTNALSGLLGGAA